MKRDPLAAHPFHLSPRRAKSGRRGARPVWAVAAVFLTGGSTYSHDQSAQIGAQESRANVERVALDPRVTMRIGHPDLGEINLVQRQPRPDTFTLSTNQLFSYTSNAFLRPQGEQGSLVWNGRLAATWVPYSTRSFTPSITFEQNFFRFDKFPGLDFDTQTITGAVKLDLTRDGRLFSTTSGSINRLYTSRFDAADFYKFALFSESVTYIHQLGNSPVYTGSTLGANWRLGNPSTFDRFSFFLNEAAIWSPVDKIQLAVFVRPEVHFFTNHDGGTNHHGDTVSVERASTPTDFNLSAGVAITWTPIKNVSVSTNFLWTKSWSTYAPHEYDVYTPSIGFTVSVAF